MVTSSRKANPVRVQAARQSELAQVVLEFCQTRLQACGEENRSERIALIDAAGGGKAATLPLVVPEVILGSSSRERLSARRQFRCKRSKLVQARLSVGRTESVLGVER